MWPRPRDRGIVEMAELYRAQVEGREAEASLWEGEV